MLKRLILVLVLTTTATALLPASALGATPLATYESPACAADAPVWNILYRFHSANDRGGTITASNREKALQATERFVREVANLSECSVRVRVEVVDEPAPYSGHATPPSGYDAVFARYPAYGDEGFAGQASGTGSAVFPVKEGSSGPNTFLVMHEWLHLVVSFYDPPLGWPRDDVHGACSRDDYRTYTDPQTGTTYPCMINPRWFADLMTGRIMEDGQPKGLTKDQWAYQGKPTEPLHLPLEASSGYDTVTGEGYVIVPQDFSGAASLKIVYNGAVVRSHTFSVSPRSAQAQEEYRGERVRWEKVTRPGLYQVCVEIPDSRRYRAFAACEELGIPAETHNLITGKVKQRARQLTLSSLAPLTGRSVSMRVRMVECNRRTARCRQRWLGNTRSLVLRSSQSVRLPRVKSARGWTRKFWVRVSVARFTHDGVTWPSARVTLR